jgi:hypothetical protein
LALDADVLFSSILSSALKSAIVIAPPFGLPQTVLDVWRARWDCLSFEDVMWKRKLPSKDYLIYLAKVPKFQPEWKKHAEVLKRCPVFVFGDWSNYEAFCARFVVAKIG